MKKQLLTVLALVMTLVMFLSIPTQALAADAANAVIDPTAMCSLSIYKYDFTNAVKDGVWTKDSFTSTGVYESYVNTAVP